MLSFKAVSKQFGNTLALSNVTFSLKEGEIIGLLGLNGAGKTTTMRLIAGIFQATSGDIVVNNCDPKTQHLKIASSIGYLPENNPLYPEMLVGEYLLMIRAIKPKTTDNYSEEILKQTGLSEYTNKKIETLSRGYRQRVGLAAALLGDPSIVILDEPTSGLDPIEQEKIRKLIINLGKSKTVLFSTHVLSEVEEIATRLLILHKGKLVFDGVNPKKKGSVEELFKHYVA